MFQRGKILWRLLESPRSTRMALTIPVFGILGSEVLLYHGLVPLALGGHLLTLVVGTLALVQFPGAISQFQALLLVSAFRLVNLGMPIFVEPTFYWLPLVYGSFLPAVLLVARTDAAVEIKPGWRTAVLGFPALAVASVLLAETEYAILQPAPLVPNSDVASLAILGLLMVVFVGPVEEVLYRGILQGALEERFGSVFGLVLTSLLFAAMHAGFRSLPEVGFAFAFGLLAGVYYRFSDSLVSIAVVHGLLNLLLFAYYPLFGPLLG